MIREDVGMPSVEDLQSLLHAMDQFAIVNGTLRPFVPQRMSGVLFIPTRNGTALTLDLPKHITAAERKTITTIAGAAANHRRDEIIADCIAFAESSVDLSASLMGLDFSSFKNIPPHHTIIEHLRAEIIEKIVAA
jgi:hypothetical protein